MLISRVQEDMEDRETGDALEYQTASELFDIMARNHPIDQGSVTLSTRDLVILYKNIDLGTKLMSNAEEFKLTKKPNQYVETIVYNDDLDSEGSDCEIYSNEDIHNVFSINNERIDMLCSQPSFGNTLCQKLGDLQIQASSLSLKYDQHFLFKDPYIKEQLKTLSHVDGEFAGSALPASLLDYICCKRLEDNYNFYMDNIIRYVKHTIEQLKRISNGEYLTDRAKEKWREVEDVRQDDHAKVLATSTSIPLQVERKVNGLSTTWDDIIHSEVDVRSLSKILEKKIIVEVPKQICGSYKLFSKLCTDNLVISCTREEQAHSEEKESRVDVVLKLGRSDTGQVVSNISSIMILQPTSPAQPVQCPKILPIAFNQIEDENIEKKKVKIVEIEEIIDDYNESVIEENSETGDEEMENDATPDNLEEDDNNLFDESKNNSMVDESGDSSVALKDILDTRAIPDILRKEAPYDFISPDDLSLAMNRLNMSCLPEESSEDVMLNPMSKKKSQTKVRVKSPYENKSHALEEKKRKKLLEIREKREKKKMAANENCKITKHRYGKGPIMPQSSSSVTKLSITNKSFYNSIYGQNQILEKQLVKNKGRISKRELMFDQSLDQVEGEVDTQLTPEKNNKQYINRSYYLDEAVTEMMYTQMKPSECGSARETFSNTPSAVSGEFSANINIMSQIINLPESGKNEQVISHIDGFDEEDAFGDLPDDGQKYDPVKLAKNIDDVPVPSNSPKDEEDSEDSKKELFSLECRKSIDKLYDLMNKIGKIDSLGLKSSRSRLSATGSKMDTRAGQESSTARCSDSGTSLKHHLTSSNPSSFSFEKVPNPEDKTVKDTSNKTTDALTTVVPKVIISTKQQTGKIDLEKTKKDRRRTVITPLTKVPDNPLKAISQLLHEFENVQKTRHKPTTDSKSSKKPEIPLESRHAARVGTPKRRSRTDHSGREREVREMEMVEAKNVKVITMKERRPKPNPVVEPLRIPHQQVASEEKHVDRPVKKKLTDILDEVKEAKGEAVRGPSKLSSRLNSLAQPKKSYVQAQNEEFQTKYGKSLMADRLHRVAATTPPPRARLERRRGAEALSSVSVRPPPVQPLERVRPRRSAGSSPEGRTPDAPCKQGHAADAPDTLKKRMVAVESYVKSHYGRSSPLPPGDLLKARVPLVPTDIDLGSVQSSPAGEDSAAIGNRLHNLISSMLGCPSPLGALPEAHEGSPRATPPHERDSAPDRASSADSDYRADIFADKQVETAVEAFPVKLEEGVVEPVASESLVKYELESTASSVEIQKLEEVLQGKMSSTSRKRLRLRNVTLTPKHSLQQFLFLESGDTSLVVKSTASKSLKTSSSRSDADLRVLANLPEPNLVWNLTNIPLQVATIGYAFPDYNAAFSRPSSAIRSLDNMFSFRANRMSAEINNTSHKTGQCLNGMAVPRMKHEVPFVSEENIENPIIHPLPPSKEIDLTTASVATEPFISHSSEEKHEKDNDDTVKGGSDDVDCTSSLDMLVGILNEIQKITTSHMTNTEIFANEHECNELETLLCKDASLKEIAKRSDSQELVSIASLDKLRQLESSPSIYSLYLSNDDKNSVDTIDLNLNAPAKSVTCDHKPDCVDKQISANFSAKELIDTFTEVPSKFFPVTITHSTNITNSLLGILSKPSNQTVISLNEYDTISPTFSREKNVIEITEDTRTHEMLMIEYPKNFKFERPIQKCDENASPNKLLFDFHNTSEKKQLQKCKVIKQRASSKEQKMSMEVCLFRAPAECRVKSGDFDPLLRVKRDILVTVYSMLVLTVFAALSFPGTLYYV